MIFQHDTRDKPGKHGNVEDFLLANGHKVVRSKLYVGDITLLDRQSTCIDLKQDLTEVCGNLCQQHERFRAELLRAQEAGIRLIILVEHGHGIRSMEDVERWKNPRARHSPGATTGAQLAKIMRTMAERYGIEWRFCDKKETGREIIRALTEGE